MQHNVLSAVFIIQERLNLTPIVQHIFKPFSNLKGFFIPARHI